MKIFFTMWHSIIPLLREVDGIEVIYDERYDYRSFVDWEEPESKDYPLKRILRDVNPDVLVCIGPAVRWEDSFTGYFRGAVIPWYGQIEGRAAVCMTEEDPAISIDSRRRLRGCDCIKSSFHAYVTNDEKSARERPVESKRVLYEPGSDPCNFIDCLRDICSRTNREKIFYGLEG